MKTKRFLAIMATAIALTACSDEALINSPNPEKTDKNANEAMSFSVKNKNMTRVTKGLETESYNFGVWAVKESSTTSTGTTSTTNQNVMENYLVGYHADGTGYALSTTTPPSTWGESDNLNDATSQWFYEGLGYKEYEYDPDKTEVTTPLYFVWNKGNAITGGHTASTAAMSNHENQYLKYWDYSSTKVEFYAYAPYVKSVAADATAGTAEVKAVEFDYNTKKLTIHDYSKVNMVASATVNKSDYKKDVTLLFMRLGASVGVKFWNAIPGYEIEMQDYTIIEGTGSDAKTYTGAVAEGKIVTPSGKYTYNFITVTGSFETYPTATATKIAFAVPAGNIGTTQATASPSPDNYMNMVPVTYDATADTIDYPNSALTFHVNFKLKSVDTNETIEVKNATVVVPEEWTNWQNSTVYTYIFKITKNANGYTGDDTDPAGLYPIVFDQIQVTDGTDKEQEFDISATTVSLALPEGASVTGSGTATAPYEISATAAQTFTVTVGNMTSASSTAVYATSTFESVATATSTAASGTVPTKTATLTVTPVAAGTTIINAWNSGVKSSDIYVKVPLTISAATADLTAGTGTATLTTNAATTGTVVWSTSNPDVATVVDGVVTVADAATADQKAIITATYTDAYGNTGSKACTVTVTAAAGA